MAGYDARTGKPIEGDARIAQSIRRLIRTDHDLILRRDLACKLPDMIGTPLHPVGTLARCAVIANAIVVGEERCTVSAVRPIAGGADGHMDLEIAAVSKETGKPIDLTETIS